jgi:uncharacterized membrane protein
MIFIIILLFFFLFFAFLAPVLMKYKITQPGRIIYTIYSNFCHQFAHRSWFLFGEQVFYPVYSEEGSGVRSLYDVFGVLSESVQESRKIIGNESAGYKVAICQRDVAIYGAMLIFAFIFHFSHNQINKIPFWLWFLMAVVPIGFDGFWQLISSLKLSILNISTHESTPLIRSFTGLMFGLFTGWYLYPAIEETFKDESSGIIQRIELEEE